MIHVVSNVVWSPPALHLLRMHEPCFFSYLESFTFDVSCGHVQFRCMITVPETHGHTPGKKFKQFDK